MKFWILLSLFVTVAMDQTPQAPEVSTTPMEFATLSTGTLWSPLHTHRPAACGVRRPTGTLDRLHGHITTLNPGRIPALCIAIRKKSW